VIWVRIGFPPVTDTTPDFFEHDFVFSLEVLL
jgi:hypothetical protein